MQLRIDDANALFHIHNAPTSEGAPTFVFVNALTGTTDHWEAAVAPALRDGLGPQIAMLLEHPDRLQAVVP